MLTPADWIKIARLYTYEGITITQLAQRFGTTYEGIRLGLVARNLRPAGKQRKKQKCGDNVSPN